MSLPSPGSPLAAGVAVVLALLLYLPMLARAPQNPDGAEMVLVAERGGVLHPPGFPLQGWVNRLVASSLPFSVPVALSLVSALCTALAGGVVARGLARVGCGPTAQLAGAATLLLFPPMWTCAVQPEKYGPTVLFVALALHLAIATPSRATGVTGAVTLAAVGGLGAGQHTLFALAAPALAVALWQRAALERRRLGWAALSVAVGVALAVGLYASLLAQRGAALFPDWGKLSTASDLVRHVTRAEFRFTGVSAEEGDTWRPSSFLDDELLDGMAPFALAALLGAWSAWRSRGAVRWAVLGTLGTTLAFSALLTQPGDELMSRGYLERYLTPLAVPWAVLAGLGVQRCTERLTGKARWLAPALVGAASATLASTAYSRVDGSADDTLALHQRGMGASLDPAAVYVGATDLEMMYGARVGDTLRFPVNAAYPWFTREVLPALEPRLADLREVRSTSALVDEALQRGLWVYTTRREVLAGARLEPERRGLFWAAHPGARGPASAASLEAALRLCSLLAEREAPIPHEGRYFARALLDDWRNAFVGAALHLKAEGDAAGTARALAVRESLAEGTPAARVGQACRALAEHVAPGSR